MPSVNQVQTSLAQSVRKVFKFRQGGIILVLIVLIIVMGVLSPVFLSGRNIRNILQQVSTIGILTGGGDVPGLNPCIKALVNRAIDEGMRVLGIRRGWAGLVEYNIENESTHNANVLTLDKGAVLFCALKAVDVDALCFAGDHQTFADAYRWLGGWWYDQISSSLWQDTQLVSSDSSISAVAVRGCLRRV